MKTTIDGMKGKMMKALVICGCTALFTTGAAFAESGNGASSVMNPNDSVSYTVGADDDALLQKQREIDTYLFETHADELAKEDFKVTHTAPSAGRVQIGITPYSEGNAQYLYDIFGEDEIFVVEGEQAYTFVADPIPGNIEPAPAIENGAPAPGPKEQALDGNTVFDSGSAEMRTTSIENSAEGEIAITTVSAPGSEFGTTAASDKVESSKAFNWVNVVFAAAAAVVLGTLAFISRKKRTIKN